MKIKINAALIKSVFNNATKAKKDFIVIQYGSPIEGHPEKPRRILHYIFTDNYARYITPNRADKDITFVLASDIEKLILSLTFNITK